MAANDSRWHFLQLLSLFIWGLLLEAGLGGSGYLEQIANQLAAEAQQLFHIAEIVVIVILAIFSVLIFFYPVFKGIHAYMLAGPLGLIGLIIAFAAGYYLLIKVQTSVILAAVAIVLWIVGRSIIMRGAARR